MKDFCWLLDLGVYVLQLQYEILINKMFPNLKVFFMAVVAQQRGSFNNSKFAYTESQTSLDWHYLNDEVVMTNFLETLLSQFIRPLRLS